MNDLATIRREYNETGVVFIRDADEASLVSLSKKLGSIAKPRNEVSGGNGVSNIRCAPDLVGKGYSSQGILNNTHSKKLI